MRLAFSSYILMFIALGAVASLSVGCSGKGPHEPLPVSEFITSPKNFAGNVYAFRARIDRQMGFEDRVGRIVLTKTVDENEDSIPVFIGSDIQNFNPSPGQLYEFSVRVDGDGILNLIDYEKL